MPTWGLGQFNRVRKQTSCVGDTKSEAAASDVFLVLKRRDTEIVEVLFFCVFFVTDLTKTLPKSDLRSK